MLGYDIITDRIEHKPTKLQSYATEIIPDTEFSDQQIEELAEFRKTNANLCFSPSEYCANLENASIARNQNQSSKETATTSLFNNSAIENKDEERVMGQGCRKHVAC